jgi:hypothetical protein
MFQQQAEDLKRLFGEKEPSSALVQFARSEVQPIRPKVNVASPGGFFHFFPPQSKISDPLDGRSVGVITSGTARLI